jgi:uncharacterized protein YqjF (DUF2071 family)
MGWHDVSFVHWSVDPADVRAMLPPGLEPDTYDGAAWVTLIPFNIVGLRALRVLPVPPFGECNVRTYARAGDGSSGIWFDTLEARSLATVLGGRYLYGVDYHRAAVDVRRDGDVLTTRSRRRDRTCDLVVRMAAPLEKDALDVWLTERYVAYGRLAGRLTKAVVHHEPWPLHAATVEHLGGTLVAGRGDPVRVHASPGVETTFEPPRLVPG